MVLRRQTPVKVLFYSVLCFPNPSPPSPHTTAFSSSHLPEFRLFVFCPLQNLCSFETSIPKIYHFLTNPLCHLTSPGRTPLFFHTEKPFFRNISQMRGFGILVAGWPLSPTFVFLFTFYQSFPFAEAMNIHLSFELRPRWRTSVFVGH